MLSRQRSVDKNASAVPMGAAEAEKTSPVAVIVQSIKKYRFF
jgi:hypothetical protein